MTDLNDFFEAHCSIEFLRRQNIAEYWDENQEDDVIARLTPRQINHLVVINRYGPCSLHTVTQHTGLSSSAASAAIDKMVRLGIVDRVQNRDNRREIQVTLTPAIRNHLARIDLRFRTRIAAILADCTDEEAESISRSAGILRRKFDFSVKHGTGNIAVSNGEERS